MTNIDGCPLAKIDRILFRGNTCSFLYIIFLPNQDMLMFKM